MVARTPYTARSPQVGAELGPPSRRALAGADVAVR